MAFTVVQSGSNLHMLGSDGTPSAPLVLPTGVTLANNIPARFLAIDSYVILVNTPNYPLLIDSAGKVRLLVPRPPRLGATLSGAAGGTLSGTYAGVRYTFVVTDEVGNLISESDYAPASGSVTIANQFLQASGLDISPDDISGRRLYRPQSGGAVLFQWVDLDGNVLTSVQDDLSDASLSLIAAPTLGNPPYLTHIASFKGRLFGVAASSKDEVRYTEAGVRYAWPDDNVLQIPLKGADDIGVTAFLPRRDYLGVGKENRLTQITGTGIEDADGVVDLDVVVLSEELGVLGQETAQVYRDTAFFLWYDGVYRWDSSGIKNVSDNQVSSWFNTDNYFNRSQFPNAFAQIDPVRGKYRLCLFEAGSLSQKRWVEYDFTDGSWWGPHKSGIYVPTAYLPVTGVEDDASFPATGTQDGNVCIETETRTDGTATAIEMDVITKAYAMDAPRHEKFWGQLSLFGKKQMAGTLTITATVGDLEAEDVNAHTTALSYNMTKTRQRLGRIGMGKHIQLELFNNEVGQNVDLWGLTVDPVNLVGER